MHRLIWGLYVEHEWVPGAERLMGPPSGDLHGTAYHERNAARMATKRLMEHLLLTDETADEVAS